MKLAAVVLAAGASRRFGGRKQLAELDGKSLLSRTLQQVQPLFGADLYTVIGAYGAEVAPQAAAYSTVLENPDWAEGLGNSLSFGVRQVLAQREDYDGILVALADQVALRQDHFAALCQAYQGQGIVAAHYGGRSGVPAIFAPSYFEALMALKGDKGAQKLLRDAADLVTLPLPEAAFDIDTQADLEHFYEVQA